MDSSGARSFLTDALGTTLGLTDSIGSIQTSYSYEPFVSVAVSGTITTNSFTFTGREMDATGLYFYRARYYAPALQRFFSEDPIGFDGGDMVLYAYANANPISRFDPLGLSVDDSSKQELQTQLVQRVQNLFPGSTFDPETNQLNVPEDIRTVLDTLQAQGYREPGQPCNATIESCRQHKRPLNPGVDEIDLAE